MVEKVSPDEVAPHWDETEATHVNRANVRRWPPLLRMLLRWIAPSLVQEPGVTLEDRLFELEQAIARHPQTLSNYVLRGELYLDIGDYESAIGDFQRALELAAAQLERDDWGVVAQTMRDRAQHGLEKALRLIQSSAGEQGW